MTPFEKIKQEAQIKHELTLKKVFVCQDSNRVYFTFDKPEDSNLLGFWYRYKFTKLSNAK